MLQVHMPLQLQAHTTYVHTPHCTAKRHKALQILPEQGHLKGDGPLQSLDGPREGSHKHALLLLALIPLAHKQRCTHCCTVQRQRCLTHITIQRCQILVPATRATSACMEL